MQSKSEPTPGENMPAKPKLKLEEAGIEQHQQQHQQRSAPVSSPVDTAPAPAPAPAPVHQPLAAQPPLPQQHDAEPAEIAQIQVQIQLQIGVHFQALIQTLIQGAAVGLTAFAWWCWSPFVGTTFTNICSTVCWTAFIVCALALPAVEQFIANTIWSILRMLHRGATAICSALVHVSFVDTDFFIRAAVSYLCGPSVVINSLLSLLFLMVCAVYIPEVASFTVFIVLTEFLRQLGVSDMIASTMGGAEAPLWTVYVTMVTLHAAVHFLRNLGREPTADHFLAVSVGLGAVWMALVAAAGTPSPQSIPDFAVPAHNIDAIAQDLARDVVTTWEYHDSKSWPFDYMQVYRLAELAQLESVEVRRGRESNETVTITLLHVDELVNASRSM